MQQDSRGSARMRVLIVHNRYRSEMPSGENRVVEFESAALEQAGVAVSTYLRSSDELATLGPAAKLALVGSPLHSRRAVREVAELIERERPDVLHLHNPYPLISNDVIGMAKDAGVAVVQTVHNHRLTCMKGTYQRDGGDCHDCLRAGSPRPGVVHACYRDSRAQSVVMAAALVRHRRRTEPLVDRYIALTPEIEQSLRHSGVSADRIVLKPNTVPDPGPAAPPGEGFLYLGRLSEEKGVLLLLDAWARHPAGSLGRLTIAGDGPVAQAVAERAGARDDVEFLGRVPGAEVPDLIRRHGVVVIPSTWPEAFPLTVLEALAAGRPLLVSDVGGLPRVVDPRFGWVVPPTQDAWSAALATAAQADDWTQRGRCARETYDAVYSPPAVTEALIEVYRGVTAR